MNPQISTIWLGWWCTPGRQRQRDLCAEGQPALQSEFQDSQGCYTEKPFLEKGKKIPTITAPGLACIVYTTCLSHASRYLRANLKHEFIQKVLVYFS